MTHRIVVNVQTREVIQVQYTPEEQAAHDAAIASQAEVNALADTQAAQLAETTIANEVKTEIL